MVALRTDPQLRSLVEDAAFWAIGAADPRAQNGEAAQTSAIEGFGYGEDSEEARVLKELGITDAATSTGSVQSAPVASTMPQSRVKIYRPNSG